MVITALAPVDHSDAKEMLFYQRFNAETKRLAAVSQNDNGDWVRYYLLCALYFPLLHMRLASLSSLSGSFAVIKLLMSTFFKRFHSLNDFASFCQDNTCLEIDTSYLVKLCTLPKNLLLFHEVCCRSLWGASVT